MASSTFEEIRNERVRKLNLLKEAGVDSFPAVCHRDTSVKAALQNFADLKNHTEEITLAGRIMAIRIHGGVVFADIFDGSCDERIQVVIKKDDVSTEKFDLFVNTVDVGDFVEFPGVLFLTKRGEKSLQAKAWRILTKSLRPLPDKWHGLQDEDEKLRKRYLDYIFNQEVRDIVQKRFLFWKSMREFLLKNDFIEVETPVLENNAGGADAKPFATHHNALDMDVYLRISMGELWQKRLMVAGMPKTFEIGRQFRNEGMSVEHAQDYTQMEFYWAYANYRDGMNFVRELYRYVAKETFGTGKFTIGKFEVDLDGEWREYDFVKTVEEKTGINIDRADIKEIEAKLQELHINYEKKGFNWTRAVDNLWKFCRKGIAGPGFLVNVPVSMEPLAKRQETDKTKVQRFQIILAGSELGKGYSELNDPIDQAGRFEEQQKLRDAGDEEAHPYDKDFVEALEYGMPPTCGFGVSERLFSFLMNKSVRECQIFPLMKPRE